MTMKLVRTEPLRREKREMSSSAKGVEFSTKNSLCARVCVGVCVCRLFRRILAYKSASSANTVYAK